MIPDEPQSGELTADEKKRIFMTLDAQTAMIEKTNRGMYGDVENGVKGLIARVTSIEDWNNKAKLKIAFIAGAGATIAWLFNKAWEWITTHK